MSSRDTPFEEMERLFDRMRRPAFGRYGAWDEPAGFDAAADAPTLEASRPGVDVASGRWQDANLSVEETADGSVVVADLPGFERDEIDLRFRDGVLYVAAIHETADDHDARDGHVATRRRRHVHERIRVPGAVDEGAISATYRNGVLAVHLPTGDEASGTVIEVE